jgi:hypothetical protein
MAGERKGDRRAEGALRDAHPPRALGDGPGDVDVVTLAGEDRMRPRRDFGAESNGPATFRP